MPYDRFVMAGGLDTATPYLSRQPGSLLSCRNFYPESDGGYRMSGGFERFDGRPSPSAVIVKNLHGESDFTALLPGQIITTSPSGHKVRIGRVYGNEAWVDVISGGEITSGELVAGVLIEYVTTEFIDYRNFNLSSGTETTIMEVDPGVDFAPVEGGKVRGLTTGAEAQITFIKHTSTLTWLYVQVTKGAFQAGESVQDVNGHVAVLATATNVEAMLSDPATPASVWYYLSELRRRDIGMVPGDGSVNGVWDLEGVVYAVRNDTPTGGGRLYKSTPTGWQAVDLGMMLKWKDRPATVNDDYFLPGDVIKGSTSNATLTIGWVGFLSQDHKLGYLSAKSITGTFVVGENLINTSQSDTVVGVVSDAAVTNSLPLGGRYRFANNNFYGSADGFAMFGVNGVGPAFAYNESRGFTSIYTGREVEDPYDLAVYKDHLFLAYPNARLQHSSVGLPLDWTGGLGALEVGVGSEIMSLIPAPKALIICTEKDIQALSGDGVYNWEKDIITSHTGVSKFTGQYQSQSFVLAQAGIVAIDRTDQFGNFSDSVVSDKIRSILVPQYEHCTGAQARKDISQYRLFYDGGTGVTLSTYRGEVLGLSQFDHGGLVVRASANPYGRIFFVSDTGYVYQDDVGYSNDGEERVSLIRTSYANQGDPDTRKRYRRADITLSSDSFINMMVGFTYDKGANDTAFSVDSGVLTSQGGRWDLSQWNMVFWDSAEYPTVSTDVDGIGYDVGLMIYVQSRIHPPFVVEDVALEWTPRRKVR